VAAFGSQVTVKHHPANILPLKKQHTHIHIYINLEAWLSGGNGTFRMLL
jgi:hypothetical protein